MIGSSTSDGIKFTDTANWLASPYSPPGWYAQSPSQGISCDGANSFSGTFSLAAPAANVALISAYFEFSYPDGNLGGTWGNFVVPNDRVPDGGSTFGMLLLGFVALVVGGIFKGEPSPDISGSIAPIMFKKILRSGVF
jgi:hypothetical protein